MSDNLSSPVRSSRGRVPTLAASLGLTALLSLTACGGGSDGSTAANLPTPPAPQADPTAVPADVAASVGSYVSFVGQQPIDDAREPLSLQAVAVAPVTDTDEPQDLP